MQIALVGVLLAAAVVASQAAAGTHQLGRSWQGRPIDATEVGDPAGIRVLVVGVIHGNETAGLPIVRALERLKPPGIDLWIVPDLNPDGVAAGAPRRAGLV
jgi:protein MpaA